MSITPGDIRQAFRLQPAPDPRIPDITTHRGFAGWMGADPAQLPASAKWRVGWQEGYEMIDNLTQGGWDVAPEGGEWPYVIYMTHTGRDGLAILEYCEGDLTLWTDLPPEIDGPRPLMHRFRRAAREEATS